jgi:hypothetical protein
VSENKIERRLLLCIWLQHQFVLWRINTSNLPALEPAGPCALVFQA